MPPTFTLALPFRCRVIAARKPAVTLHDKRRKGYPDVLKSLGDHLRKRRLDLGMTLRQAADRIGTRSTLLHEWEKGRKRPAAWWRRAIVSFLGYDPFGGPEGVATSSPKSRTQDAKAYG
jgi:ribosome-binding protein aMBF1 (putative translation factor)